VQPVAEALEGDFHGIPARKQRHFLSKTFLNLLNSSIHMPKTQSCFAFRWLLPIVQIVVCLTVLWPWRATLIQQIRGSVRAYRTLESSLPRAHDPAGASVSVYIYPDPEELRKTQALERDEWVPMMLNLPSGLVQLPYVILNPSREDWTPRGITLRTWRVLSWPIVGILFWWSAGRGIEALVAGRRRMVGPRITWFETVVAAALFLFCGIAAVSLPLSGYHDRNFPLILWILGSGTWALLGGLTVTARAMQWRLATQMNVPAQCTSTDRSYS
jgi:hypothetical protein